MGCAGHEGVKGGAKEKRKDGEEHGRKRKGNTFQILRANAVVLTEFSRYVTAC